MNKLMAMAVAVTAVATGATLPAVADPNTADVVKVTIETSLGDIELELDAAKAPISVANFMAYAKAGHYDGTVFHRVINGFMIQGGGFTPDMQQKATRAPIKNEAANGLRNTRGTIAMARTAAVDSATSQFFINHKDNAFLDHAAPNPRQFGYAVFGHVTKGMDIVDKIAQVKTGNVGYFQDVPVEPVVIRKVVVAVVPVAAKSGDEAGLFETIRSRTSVRKFDPAREVSAADEEKLLRAAMCAPSAMNKQPWEFVVVRDPAKLQALGSELPYSRVGNGARMAIVVCGNLDNGLPDRGKEYWIQDCSAATMNLLLAAKALGFGAVWTGVYPGEDRVATVRRIVGIPDDYMPLNVVPVGYPAENPQPKDKWNAAKVHRDSW